MKYRMSTTRPNTLIPYFTAYLIHYFHNSKTKCDETNGLQNRIVVTSQPKKLLKK